MGYEDSMAALYMILKGFLNLTLNPKSYILNRRMKFRRGFAQGSVRVL